MSDARKRGTGTEGKKRRGSSGGTKPVMLPGTIATRNAPPFAGYSPTQSPYMTPTGDPNIDAHRFLDTMSAMRRFKRLIDESRDDDAQNGNKKGENTE